MRVAFAALAILWLATTGWAFEAGRRAEAEYREAVGALARESDAPIEIERYERGVFGSDVVTIVGPAGLAEGETSAARLVLRQKIDHGPYPFSWVASDEFDGRPILARVQASPTLELETEAEIEEVPLPLAVGALFTRDEGGSVWMVPDPDAEALDDPELSGDWEDVYAEVGFAYDGSAWSADVEVPRIAFDGEDAHFRLEDLIVELDYERAPTAPVFVGSSRLRLGLLAFGGPDGTFLLRELDVENASDVSQGSWSLQVDGSLGALEGGPGAVPQRLGGGEVAIRIGGIALGPLAELESVGAAIEADGPAGDLVKAELVGAAGALWPQLMAPGPEIEVSRLRLETPDGEIRAAFRAAMDPSEPGFLVHPLMSLPALELDFELSLPGPVLEGWLASPRPVAEVGVEAAPWVAPAELASRRVETWIERGHLGERDGHYVASVRIRKGTLRLNGRVVSFEAL